VKVAFSGAFAVRLAERVRAHLAVPCDIILVNDAGRAEHAGIVARLADVDVLVTLAFTREMGAAAVRLKLVQVPGAGLNQIDRGALPAGAWLANAHGHETGIAEFVIGVMLAWSWGFGRLDAGLRRGAWMGPWAASAEPPPPWPELAGKTLGILGYGRIGQCVARRALAFDMSVRAIRQSAARPETRGLAFLGGPDALDDVVSRADYLVITLPLTPKTLRLLGERELRLMKSSAVLVNVARAEIVDEDALYQALAQGIIAGAALDVWYRYPAGDGPTFPARRPFHELSNVLMTPHVAGWTEGTLEARAKLIADNILRVAKGEPPLNVIPQQR
jgi:phosphoglycerate dehydrogenase-like enzyme